jgi:hypothetical protein
MEDLQRMRGKKNKEVTAVRVGSILFWTNGHLLGSLVIIITMSATIEISLPDALVKALDAKAGELPRKTLEALVAQSYRSGKISHADAGELLGFDRWQTDAFLKSAQAYRPGEGEEFGRDLATVRKVDNK